MMRVGAFSLFPLDGWTDHVISKKQKDRRQRRASFQKTFLREDPRMMILPRHCFSQFVGSLWVDGSNVNNVEHVGR
jgi:hypothetical protein